MENFDYIKGNYSALLSEIAEAREKRRFSEEVRLVCVTKSGSDDELLALAALGATDIGENRPQELRRRGDLLAEHGYFPALHEIGNLQTNKVKLIAERTSLVHSLDSLALAKELEKQAKKFSRRIPVLIEINSGEEAQKGGVLPGGAMDFLSALGAFPSLEVRGLMTMGPVSEDPEDLRPYFRRTRELFDKIKQGGGFTGEPILSMGMSDSFRVAIEEGSTLVRVGRRLFRRTQEEKTNV